LEELIFNLLISLRTSVDSFLKKTFWEQFYVPSRIVKPHKDSKTHNIVRKMA